ncbi:MAG: ribulose-phosphate 3-epimerase [Synergistaceae bacterium]|nr:ribulose-phosphate 3-epimerase [Synergistaceae bacterium]
MEFSASMMCADFGNLHDEVRSLDEAGIDKYHIDIMDGMFVPNLGMGLQDIKCIRSLTSKPIEAHLMVCKVNSYIDILAGAGVNTIFIHPEADYHPFTTLQRIIDLGMTPGIVIDPGTSVETVRELFNVSKNILVMAVTPGFAGQSYLPYVAGKIRELLALKHRYGLSIFWDGSCTLDKIAEFSPMGVDGFVLGTNILFKRKTTRGGGGYFSRISEARNAAHNSEVSI